MTEEQIFDLVSKALRAKFDTIFISGVELTSTPPQFPAVSIVQMDSTVNTRGSTFEKVNNVSADAYTFNAFSNLESQKEAKEQTKEIMAVIDEVMSGLFYLRTFCSPVANADPTITRRVARYTNNNVTLEV